jgi:peptidoglycan/LPS O-acetylase OafA/YrhL
VGSIRRVVDRYFALALAVSPLWTTLAPSVGHRSAWAWTVGSLAVLAVLLVEYGPDHDSDDVWWFGGATLLADFLGTLGARYGYGVRLDDHPAAAVAVWLVAVGVGLAVALDRRSPAQDTSRR